MKVWNLRTFCIISALLIAGFMGCSTVGTDNATNPTIAGLERESQAVSIVGSDGAYCVKLFAGQTIDAGTVCFSDDDLDQDGNLDTLIVTYQTTNGWELVETHFWLGSLMADMPMTNKGNPIPGQFPYVSGDITGQTLYSFNIPFSAFGMTCPGDPKDFFVAAHAAVRKPNGSGGYQTETGWGEGERITSKGNWATYFQINISCEGGGEGKDCETAFAYGNQYATCFLDLTVDEFNRWGWTNGPLTAGNYEFPIYAGAGQCDLTKGTYVGTLYVNYDGSSATVTYDMFYGFYLDETHLYVGNEILARNVQGDYTVAPGQFLYKHDLSGAYTDTFTVYDLSGEIYVVAHAVVCTEFVFKAPPLPPPTVNVTWNASYPGPNSYWNVTLSNVPVAPEGQEPYEVWNGTGWLGWCVDQANTMYPNSNYLVKLLSSYDPSVWPSDSRISNVQWDYVNYVINHKVAGATINDIQAAIWYFCPGGTMPAIGTKARIMVDDALANGDGWFPTEGQNMALICYYGPGVQLVLIEIDP